MRLTVRPGGSLVLSAPERVSVIEIERFLTEHSVWIAKAQTRMQDRIALPAYGRREYRARRGAARAFVIERLTHWNALYGHTVGRIAIKNTRSLWGSCSQKGNLNFSYALIHLPQYLADYIIVHELCHLVEHNHSKSFWKLVARALPEYPLLRRELARYSLRA